MKKVLFFLLMLSSLFVSGQKELPNEIKITNPGNGNICIIGFDIITRDSILVYTLDTSAYTDSPKRIFTTTFENGATKRVHFITQDTVQCRVKYLTRIEFQCFLDNVYRAVDFYNGSHAFKKAEESCFYIKKKMRNSEA